MASMHDDGREEMDEGKPGRHGEYMDCADATDMGREGVAEEDGREGRTVETPWTDENRWRRGQGTADHLLQ